jgi:PBP1b-binding outer membrane lipoprotein LpoB
MQHYLAIAAIGGALGLAGCATSTAPAASSGQEKVATEAEGKGEQRFITGSRLPEKPPQDRMLKSVDSQAYKENQTSVLGVQPRGN